MSKKQRCPECKQWLEKNASACLCGWKSKDRADVPIADYRCSYEIEGKRCPLTGNCSPMLYGNGPWFCFEHLRHLDDPKKCKEILIDAENNFMAIMEASIDWRRKIFPEDYRVTKSHIRKLFEEINKK